MTRDQPGLYFQGNPRDAYSIPGRYSAGPNHPGTERYHLYGMWPPRDGFVRARDLHFSVVREGAAC